MTSIIGRGLNDPVGAIIDSRIHWFTVNEQNQVVFEQADVSDSIQVSHVAVRGDGRVAVALVADSNSPTTILEFEDMETMKRWYSQREKNIFSLASKFHVIGEVEDHVKSLIAAMTVFIALTHGGVVFSWGQARLPHQLGRPITTDYPAEVPSILPQLRDVPIKKIAGGSGFLLGALSASGDVYIWGRKQGQDNFTIPDLDEDPDPDLHWVDAESQCIADIIDFSIGADHIVVLGHESGPSRSEIPYLWRCGDNTMGQCFTGDTRQLRIWMKYDISQSAVGLIPTGVECGNYYTLILVTAMG
jgi:alpha-tubulin suppressor-like RCC1 family protein